MNDCPLCAAQGEAVLLQTDKLRVIAVCDEPHVPAFCRVIWRAHVAEMTDLLPDERNELMEMVYRVESAMRQILKPAKMNLASFGNIVPHLHWHVIARFEEDAHFPSPVWAPVKRETSVGLPENWPHRIKELID